MEKFTLTISRQYGSGGRKIGEEVAKKLGIPFYDKAIVHMVAEKSGMSADYIEESDGKIPSTFSLQYTGGSYLNSAMYYEMPVSDKVFVAQAAVVKEVAEKESCVIVGRCADYVLRENPGLVAVFIRGDLDDRVKNAVANDEMEGEKAADKIKKIDKSRSNYYNYYTHRQWGNVENYDLVINTSFTGVDGAVAIIMTMLREKGLI